MCSLTSPYMYVMYSLYFHLSCPSPPGMSCPSYNGFPLSVSFCWFWPTEFNLGCPRDHWLGTVCWNLVGRIAENNCSFPRILQEPISSREGRSPVSLSDPWLAIDRSSLLQGRTGHLSSCGILFSMAVRPKWHTSSISRLLHCFFFLTPLEKYVFRWLWLTGWEPLIIVYYRFSIVDILCWNHESPT